MASALLQICARAFCVDRHTGQSDQGAASRSSRHCGHRAGETASVPPLRIQRLQVRRRPAGARAKGSKAWPQYQPDFPGVAAATGTSRACAGLGMIALAFSQYGADVQCPCRARRPRPESPALAARCRNSCVLRSSSRARPELLQGDRHLHCHDGIDAAGNASVIAARTLSRSASNRWIHSPCSRAPHAVARLLRHREVVLAMRSLVAASSPCCCSFSRAYSRIVSSMR